MISALKVAVCDATMLKKDIKTGKKNCLKKQWQKKIILTSQTNQAYRASTETGF
jgi:hypothetical protein